MGPTMNLGPNLLLVGVYPPHNCIQYLMYELIFRGMNRCIVSFVPRLLCVRMGLESIGFIKGGCARPSYWAPPLFFCRCFYDEAKPSLHNEVF
jgi:hypothetical protein